MVPHSFRDFYESLVPAITMMDSVWGQISHALLPEPAHLLQIRVPNQPSWRLPPPAPLPLDWEYLQNRSPCCSNSFFILFGCGFLQQSNLICLTFFINTSFRVALSLVLSATKSVFSFKLIQVPFSTTSQEDLQTAVKPPN